MEIQWTKVKNTSEIIARGVLVLIVIGSMLGIGWNTDPGGRMVDRILVWSFVVFAVGLAELFALFVLLAIVGRINLPRAFEEKNSGDVDSEAAEAEASGGKQRTPKHTISLSRLQAFMWTLIVMTVYFHRVVTNKSGELPTIPAELLMVMGISSAVYLTSKGIEAQSSKQKPAASSQVGAGATSAQVQTVGGG